MRPDVEAPIAPANQGCISCIIEVSDEDGITRGFSSESCDDGERATVGLCSGSAGTSEELAVDIAAAARGGGHGGADEPRRPGLQHGERASKLAFEAVVARILVHNPGLVAGGGTRGGTGGEIPTGWTVFRIPSTP